MLRAFSTVLAKAASAIDSKGRKIWIADAHRDDGKRFVVRADEKLTAFLELESAIFQLIRCIENLLFSNLAIHASNISCPSGFSFCS